MLIGSGVVVGVVDDGGDEEASGFDSVDFGFAMTE